MTITREQVLEDLQKIVDEFGEDYTYKERLKSMGVVPEIGCFYRVSSGPGCLVGVYFDKIGVEVPSEYNDEGVFDLPSSIIDLFEENAVYSLRIAQDLQDQDYTWSDAVEFARKTKDEDD